MNPNTFPTKGNLILAKNSLALAVQGYGLMDKKRNILLKELTGLIGQARSIQSEIDSTFTSAYRALQKANIELGVRFVEEIADSIPTEDSIRVKARSRLVQHQNAGLHGHNARHGHLWWNIRPEKRKGLPIPFTAPAIPWTRPAWPLSG